MKTILFFLLTAIGSLAQGPSAPPAAIFGLVRNLAGEVIDNPDFEQLAIFADDTEIGRVPLELIASGAENYRFEIPNISELSTAKFSVKLIRDDGEIPLEESGPWLTFTPGSGQVARFDFVEKTSLDEPDLAASSPPGPPPAPFTTIYGFVRNLSGGVIDNPEFEKIAIYADGNLLAEIPLKLNSGGTENYRYEIMNTSEVSTATYTAALIRDSQVVALMGSEAWDSFTPIQGEVRKFDFVEANGSFEDLDVDGLPDEWERTQLARIGESDIALLTPDGDLDFDDLTNAQEFQIGTVATDFESQLNFNLSRELSDGWIEMSFDVVAGETYFIEGSATVSGWASLDFAPDNNRSDLRSELIATTSERITVATPPRSFYRLGVR